MLTLQNIPVSEGLYACMFTTEQNSHILQYFQEQFLKENLCDLIEFSFDLVTRDPFY